MLMEIVFGWEQILLAHVSVFGRLIDDLRKSSGLHSVRAFEHGPICGRSVELERFCWGYIEHVGKMTDSREQKAEKALKMPTTHSLLAGNVQIG